MLKKESQISESVLCGLVLALSGGAMDAYSYLFRDRVFANAQTGNLLLFGVNIANGHFADAFLLTVLLRGSSSHGWYLSIFQILA